MILRYFLICVQLLMLSKPLISVTGCFLFCSIIFHYFLEFPYLYLHSYLFFHAVYFIHVTDVYH